MHCLHCQQPTSSFMEEIQSLTASILLFYVIFVILFSIAEMYFWCLHSKLYLFLELIWSTFDKTSDVTHG